MDRKTKEIPLYTKGPWQKTNGTQIIDTCGNVIAQTHAHRKICLHDGLTIALPMGVGIDHEYELSANTNLIAEAPCMLACLKDTVQYLVELMDMPTIMRKDEIEILIQRIQLTVQMAERSERST